MIPNARRIAPPIKISNADVSPTLPATLPRNSALYSSGLLSAVVKPSPSGVAVVTASAIHDDVGAIHRARDPANETDTNARPAIAGLKMLNPSPPKASLAIAMEKIAPTTTIHSGVRGGRMRTSRSPVTIALPSMKNGRRRIRFATYSVRTAVDTPTASISSA